MKYIIDWDYIPSPDDTDLDWRLKPATTRGKRSFVRIVHGNIPKLFEISPIFVKVFTVKQTYTGTLVDISSGGLAMDLPVLLEVGQPLKVDFYLGTAEIFSKAVVKHSEKIENQNITGVEFIDFDPEYIGYINGLYATLGQVHAF